MISLPTPTPATEMYNMVIACKSALATFPLSVFLDSLATTQQPALWITAKGMCRDFVRIKNVGISFNCTDRDMVTKLGGLNLNLCGRQFPIRVYSEYSHLYWIDFTLAADVQAEDVWSYFDALGDAPVLVKSSFDKNSIQSRHLTLYFATREPPASLMFSQDKSVREIYVHGTDSAPSFVHHRITKYNKGLPPSIKAQRNKNQEAADETEAKNDDPPPSTDQQEQDESVGQDHESQASQDVSKQPQPDNTTPDQSANADNKSQSEGMQDASMSCGGSSWAEWSDSESDDAASDTHSASFQETTIIVRPDLISNDPTALIPCPPTSKKASFLWERAQISRKYSRKMPNTLILDHSSVITGDYQSVQGAIVHKYPNDYNIYTLLPLEDDSTDPFPAPFPIQIADNPNVYSSIGRAVANLDLYNTPNTDVESMTIEEVTDYLEQYANGFQVQDDPEQVVGPS
ncbi:unnamed protein product [Aphanomyces euteiches]